jgi:hypothetical protein
MVTARLPTTDHPFTVNQSWGVIHQLDTITCAVVAEAEMLRV